MNDEALLAMIESLTARICHDLVGPVGAIANGVELLADDPAKPDPEVIQLIASSARSASQRLQYFRTSFGSGNALSTTRALSDARALALTLNEAGKVTVEFPAPDTDVEAAAGRQVAKILLNLLLVAHECLPRGGGIRVRTTLGADALQMTIEAEGVQARLADENRAALTSDPLAHAMSPRGVPARLAQLTAASIGATLRIEERAGRVALIGKFPRKA